MNLFNYDFVIFDCDGVLIKSGAIKTNAFYEVGLQYGEEIAKKIKKYHQEFGGISRFEKIEYLHTDLLQGEYNKQTEDVEYYGKLVQEKIFDVKLIPGVLEYINKVKTRNIFVSSGTPENSLINILSHLKIDHLFKDIKGSPSSKQDHYVSFTEKYNLKGKKGLFFGDAKEDYDTAINNGLDFVFISEDSSNDYLLSRKSDLNTYLNFKELLSSL